MNKQPKTPRTKRALAEAEFAELLVCSIEWGYRRAKKGRRSKSGQWWKRIPIEFHRAFAQITTDDIREGEAAIARGEYVTIDEMRRQTREQ